MDPPIFFDSVALSGVISEHLALNVHVTDVDIPHVLSDFSAWTKLATN